VFSEPTGEVKKSGKRGRGAAGKTPFLAAFSYNDKGHPVYMRMSKISSFTSNEINRWLSKHLHNDCIVTTDGFRPFQKYVKSLVCTIGSKLKEFITTLIINSFTGLIL